MWNGKISYFGGFRNPSSGSGLSETGSLDRAKAALERRKKAAEDGNVQGRVETTRVNPDSLIDELLRSTNLEQQDESGESKCISSSCLPICKQLESPVHWS